jgi:hypothetical protein
MNKPHVRPDDPQPWDGVLRDDIDETDQRVFHALYTGARFARDEVAAIIRRMLAEWRDRENTLSGTQDSNRMSEAMGAQKALEQVLKELQKQEGA